MGDGWRRTTLVVRAAFRPVRGRDLSLHAAAITFYGAIAVDGEGLRRAFVSVATPPDPAESLVGWRGRLLLLPLLAPAPALLLAILVALPLTTRLVRQGGWTGALGVVLSFLVVWLVLTPVLLWVFRVVGPATPDWLSALGVGSFTAANLSGFLHGFVLFCSLPLDLGVPFGGFDVIGAGVAVLLWLYLFHVIVLAGYSATLALARWRRARRSDPR
jgi:membrane protein